FTEYAWSRETQGQHRPRPHVCLRGGRGLPAASALGTYGACPRAGGHYRNNAAAVDTRSSNRKHSDIGVLSRREWRSKEVGVATDEGSGAGTPQPHLDTTGEHSAQPSGKLYKFLGTWPRRAGT